MIKITVDFTKHGNFAAWESGSYNPGTDKGWAVLVGDSQARQLQPIFQRDPQKSKHHSLFHVSIGSLVVVTNIRKMQNCDTFGIQIVVGRIESLGTRPHEKNPNQLEAMNHVHPLCSESFLSEHDRMEQRVAGLKIVIHGMDPKVIENLQKMVVLSVQKAMTLATEQRMFWGTARTPRVQRPVENKKGKFSKELVQDVENLRVKVLEAAEEEFKVMDEQEPEGVPNIHMSAPFSTDEVTEAEPEEAPVTTEAGDEAIQR